MKQPKRWGLVPVLALLLDACTVSSPFMTTLESPTPLVVDATQATIVFVRPTSFGGGMKTILLDENARFLGESWGWTYFAVQVPAGHHTFVAWAEGSHALEADVQAGRVYYVELAPTLGWWAQRLRLRAMGPGRENWNELPEWLAGCTMLVPDTPAGQAHIDERAERAREVVGKGRETFAGYDAETRAERTLRPDDGVSAPVR